VAISDRIEKAILDLSINDYENALVQISIAIDATGKKIKPKSKVGIRCRSFINENHSFIYHVAMGGSLKIHSEGKILYGELGDLGQILYKSVRCALLHEADISKTIIFKNGFALGQRNGKFIITTNMLFGLILAIVGEPKNNNEIMKQNLTVSLNGIVININEYWGKHEGLKKITSMQ